MADRERFVAGKGVFGQMDELQDSADVNLLVLSPDYLESGYCTHEMDRAIDTDPDFSKGIVLPLIRVGCTLPESIKKHDPLYIDLCNDHKKDGWDLLFRTVGTDLGVSVPDWLDARREIVRFLERGDSVNLVVRPTTNGRPRWRELITHLREDYFPGLGIIDLHSGATVSRRGLVSEILKESGAIIEAPFEPGEDLVALSRIMEKRASPAIIALTHFDIAKERPQYGLDFFAALRDLITEKRKLVILAHSRSYFNALLPSNHPLSSICNLKTVELSGKP